LRVRREPRGTDAIGFAGIAPACARRRTGRRRAVRENAPMPNDSSADFLVVGAGMAGASIAAACLRRAVANVSV